MRITSKGQVTIPQAVREAAGLLPSTEVEVVYENGNVIIRPCSEQARGRRLVEHMRKFRPFVTMSTDEIMALTRGED